MKKKTLVVIATALLLGFNSNAFSQSVKDGDVQVRAYYGYPYFVGAYVKAALESDSSAAGVDVRNTNHIGASFQIMVSEKIGLGLDYTFAKVSATYMDGVDRYKLSLTKHRITALMSFHFANSQSVDPYFNVGAGYKMNQVKYTEPGYDDSAVLKNAVPLSARLGIGLNYFFSDAIALNAEVGLGGPLVQLGLTFKF